MRRHDREITDEAEVLAILERCEVLRVALNSETYPYIVPLSFGCEVIGERPYLYVHGAKEGLRHQLLADDWRVCFEADRFDGYVQTPHGISCNYESIIGFGRAEALTGEEAAHGLQVILSHCGFPGYQCPQAQTDHTSVWRITVSQMTGKRRAE